MRCHKPCLAHSSWRRYALSHLPYASGISRHDDPVLATHRRPPSTLRWSLGGLPVPPLLWGQQGTHQCPLLVGEPRLFGRDGRGLEGRLRVERSPGVAPRRLACLAAASRHRLVSPSPQRPPQQEASSSLRLGHREHEPSRLGHRRGYQGEIEIPLLPCLSSCSTEEPTTARKAWASRQRVTWRASHPTS